MTFRKHFILFPACLLLAIIMSISWLSVTLAKSEIELELAKQGEEYIYLVAAQAELGQTEQLRLVMLLDHIVTFTAINKLVVMDENLPQDAIIYNYQRNQNNEHWLARYISFNGAEQQKNVSVGNQQLQISVSLDTHYSYRYLANLLQDGIVIGGLLLAIAAWLLTALNRYVLAPLKAIEQTAQAIAKREFKQVEVVPAVNEISKLSSSFNDMSLQMQTYTCELSERLEHSKRALYRDELTQLGNRRMFCAQFGQLLNDSEYATGALLITHLKGFDAIRSKEGFHVAKSLIEDIIHILQMKTQEGLNARIYRLNESEFACLLMNLTQTQVAELMHNIANEFNQLQNKYQRKRDILLGGCLFSSNDIMSDILNAADEAVSLAEKSIHAYHFLDPNSLHQSLALKLKGKDAVIKCISDSRLGFRQQTVMLQDESSCMFAEVYSIFHDGQQQIPTPLLQTQAEKLNIAWMLDKRIIEQLKKYYLNDALQLPISINISPFSVLDDEFWNWLEDFAHNYADFFHSVVWEFDEFSLTHIQHPHRVVSRLQQLGSKVAIDHFGTGDNSLFVLRQWNVNFIKLDGSFLRELKRGNEQWFFLENVIKLAHSLGVVVVAQQIETRDELALVKLLGVDGLQGFLLAEPDGVSLE
jgi:EAL domain-containing protein (putative c-di-GMP-specific phosphodiesterase class I)/GGDEF domain-containing protein